MKELNSFDLKILSELIKNSRISDRQLAKILKTSQPTITRKRKIFEKEGLLEYTAVPDLRKLGFEILAITFASWKHEAHPDQKIPEAQAFLTKHPGMIFVSTGYGLGSDRICVSVHRSYSDYAKLMQELKTEWEPYMEKFNSFIVSLKSDTVLRSLSFKYLVNLINPEQDQKKKAQP
jgi:DNA-binding Lrp family transcriptional regulator